MNPIRIVQPPITYNSKLTQPKNNETSKTQFQELLNEAQQTLKISKHASQRITQRNINISDVEWNKIEEKMQVAKSKGLNESLFLTQNAALIINVKNAIVVTALDRTEAGNQIFTNIDSAILI
ncbi:TIGR02530 family flagellar biosynthesis protein [Kurthia sp. ISK08]|uniref:TIGR02530 family flagellar biosynthesis protein n=1 Tax=Kurthia sp. ISK08 TaxID=3385835 RepID=UPI0038FCCAB0